MKLTPSLKEYIEQTTEQFSELLGIETPKILYYPREIMALPDNYDITRNVGGILGCCWKKYPDIIYINARKHKSGVIDICGFKSAGRKGIRTTIAHELIHLKFPKVRHGKLFGDLIRQVLRGDEFDED